MPNLYYFGVWPNRNGVVGHFLHRQGGGFAREAEARLPVPIRTLDGGLIPVGSPPGRVHRAELGRWRVYSLADRTGDSRPGSVSAFLADGPARLDDFRPAFPEVFERLRAAGVAVTAAAQPACTGVSASWCPVCGDCTCRGREIGDLNDDDCPLHSGASRHAEVEPD